MQRPSSAKCTRCDRSQLPAPRRTVRRQPSERIRTKRAKYVDLTARGSHLVRSLDRKSATRGSAVCLWWIAVGESVIGDYPGTAFGAKHVGDDCHGPGTGAPLGV